MVHDLESYRVGTVDCLGPGGFHRMAYREWGRPNPERTVVCVHGLTRNAGDFDELAAHLAAAGWHVICPDVVGRGASDWLANSAGYETPQYLADMAVLLARLDLPDARGVHWIGSSMAVSSDFASRPRRGRGNSTCCGETATDTSWPNLP